MTIMQLDVLLAAMEESEPDFAKKEVLQAARTALEAMEEDIAWTHVLISHYRSHHEDGLKIAKYMGRTDGEAKVEKFVRNDQFVKALEKRYPWLLMAVKTDDEIAGFDKAYKVDEAKWAKVAEVMPRPIAEVEEAPIPEAPVEEPYHGIMPPPAPQPSVDDDNVI